MTFIMASPPISHASANTIQSWDDAGCCAARVRASHASDIEVFFGIQECMADSSLAAGPGALAAGQSLFPEGE
jgi:hypothetical protein